MKLPNLVWNGHFESRVDFLPMVTYEAQLPIFYTAAERSDKTRVWNVLHQPSAYHSKTLPFYTVGIYLVDSIIHNVLLLVKDRWDEDNVMSCGLHC